MQSVDQQSSFWSLAPPVARLKCGMLAAEVNVARPQLGLQQLSWQAKPLAVKALGVHWQTGETQSIPGRDPHWPMQPAEAYVRANDLVATYLTEPAWPYRPQIYWRVNVLDGVPQAHASLSLIVSIQTDLLDTRSQLNAVSELAAKELVHVAVNESDHAAQALTSAKRHVLEPGAGSHCLVARLPDGRTSYAECAPASDFQEAWVTPGDKSDALKIEWLLFNEFLEKGVIRRARVHALFLPRENDVELAVACCRALAVRPLPLTT